MKHKKSDVDRKAASMNLSAIITAAILVVAIMACSNGSKTSETTPTSSEKPTTDKSSPSSSSSTTGDLAGTYSVNGTGADGKAYQGEVAITKRDAVYQMSWKVGSETYDGIAVESGKTLAAAYTTGTDGKGCGAVIYKINPDGSIEGKWGEWGSNSVGTERAVPVGEVRDGIGTFNVSGTNANGSEYKGKLSITKGGNDVYQFAWDTGTQFAGTGVKMGEYVAAGSGSKRCGFVIYQVKGDTLEGKWGVPGSTALGTEKATKK